jgi:hypothetical protein
MHLFVSGCPRSGTTALTRLLNLHPHIVVGLERYKNVFGRQKFITQDMFEAERFFDFRADDSNFLPQKNEKAREFYEQARTKFSTAAFIGDKYPQFFRFYGGIFKDLPDAKIIFIFRDPIYVAQSWEHRSLDTSAWPSKNDARRAVAYWNDALAYTLAYTQIKKNAFVFVDYEQFFAGKVGSLIELFRLIGAEVTSTIEDAATQDSGDEFKRSQEVLARDVELRPALQNELSENADRNLYRRAQRVVELQKMRF